MHKRRQLVIALFILPLVLAIFLGIFNVEVTSRDDFNYLAELADIDLFKITLDPLSWIILSLGTMVTGLTSMGLRILGLLIGVITITRLARKDKSLEMAMLFVISVMPLYMAIYFNQLRLAIALTIFVWLISSNRMSKLAIPVGALGHFSLLILLFPPLVLLIPFVMEILVHSYPDTAVALKTLTYLTNEQLDMPWYFGWELVSIGLLFALKKKWQLVCESLAVIVAVRILGAELSLDVGRRILEMGILAYSPFFLFVLRKIRPSNGLIFFFILLGILQTVISFLTGVVKL